MKNIKNPTMLEKIIETLTPEEKQTLYSEVLGGTIDLESLKEKRIWRNKIKDHRSKIICLFTGHDSFIAFSFKTGHYSMYCKRCDKDLGGN